MPLILQQDSNIMDSWLNTELTDVEQFTPRLQPHILQYLIAYKIDKSMTYNSIADSELIEKDVEDIMNSDK